MDDLDDNTINELEKSYEDETLQLDSRAARIRDRIDYCDNLIRSGMPDAKIVKQMRVKFKKLYPDYHTTTAYKDIAAAKRIHKSISKTDKEYEKIKLLDLNQWVIWNAMNSDPPNLKELNSAIATRFKLLGLDKEQNEIPKDKLKAHTIMMQFNLMGKNIKEFNLGDLPKLKLEDVKKITQTIEASMEPDVYEFLNIDKRVKDKLEDEGEV